MPVSQLQHPIIMPIKRNYETMFQTDLTLSLMQLSHQWHKIAFTSSKCDSKYNSPIQLWMKYHQSGNPSKQDWSCFKCTPCIIRSSPYEARDAANQYFGGLYQSRRVLQDRDTLKCRTQWHTRTPCSNTVASVWLFRQNYSWHFKSFHYTIKGASW